MYYHRQALFRKMLKVLMNRLYILGATPQDQGGIQLHATAPDRYLINPGNFEISDAI